MTNIAEKLRKALEVLPDELPDNDRARCAFYATNLSTVDIMQLRKDTFHALDAYACKAETQRRSAA